MDIINSFETQEYEGKLNSALVLSEISDNKNFVELFKSEKVNQRLFEILKSQDDLTVRSTLNFMNTLYRKFPFYRPKAGSENEQDNFAKMYLPSSSQNGEDMEVIDHIDQLLKDELGTIVNIIDQEPEKRLEQQYGKTIATFGATRLQAIKFVTHILAQGNTDYALKLSPCLPSILQYCLDYPWNSMLHNNVEIIFNELFKKSSNFGDEVRTAVIAETKLADFISNLEVKTQMPDSGRSIRTSTIATFVNIANLLQNHHSEYVHEELQKSEKWREFAENELKLANENNEKALAGHQSKAGDSDEEAGNYETSMDKLFAVFTNLKESHDSSRELEDSDEDEQIDTTNILKDLDDSSDSLKSDSSRNEKGESGNKDKSSRKKKSKVKKDKTKRSDKGEEDGTDKQIDIPVEEVKESETPQNTKQIEAEVSKPVSTDEVQVDEEVAEQAAV